ncbi:MAG: GTP 3',8-cyclase MoaA [Pseudomonadaceae bacterium]|nr:GTP 3',8-cyclase MoaA [Pseudomonadaceae bacterium]
MIVDHLGRQFRNLRLSLTAACNYACTYCVPDGKRLLAANAELEADEMVKAVGLLIDTAGIDKLRITGGEPLLSPKFDAILPEVMQLGLADVSLTTNGQLLPRKAPLIIEAGLKRINISLDTLDDKAFRDIARSGDLATVLKGIDLMLEAGIKVKLNMVPMRGRNDHQILTMLDYALARGIELRFIELMNMGHLQGNALFERQFYGMDEILELIAQQYEFTRAEAPLDSTAARFEIPDRGMFGIIANESEPFCRTCSRLRLSSNGKLYGCLSNAKSYDLRHLLSLPEPQAIAQLQSILGNALADKQLASFRGEVTVMKFIGG